jgi:hypothetical protein
VGNRRFRGGGTESLAHEVHVTTGSSNSNGRVTRHLLPIQTPHVHPPHTHSTQEGRRRGGTKGAVVTCDEGGVFGVASGGKEGRGVHVQCADRG